MKLPIYFHFWTCLFFVFLFSFHSNGEDVTKNNVDTTKLEELERELDDLNRRLNDKSLDEENKKMNLFQVIEDKSEEYNEELQRIVKQRVDRVADGDDEDSKIARETYCRLNQKGAIKLANKVFHENYLRNDKDFPDFTIMDLNGKFKAKPASLTPEDGFFSSHIFFKPGKIELGFVKALGLYFSMSKKAILYGCANIDTNPKLNYAQIFFLEENKGFIFKRGLEQIFSKKAVTEGYSNIDVVPERGILQSIFKFLGVIPVLNIPVKLIEKGVLLIDDLILGRVKEIIVASKVERVLITAKGVKFYTVHRTLFIGPRVRKSIFIPFEVNPFDEEKSCYDGWPDKICRKFTKCLKKSDPQTCVRKAIRKCEKKRSSEKCNTKEEASGWSFIPRIFRKQMGVAETADIFGHHMKVPFPNGLDRTLEEKVKENFDHRTDDELSVPLEQDTWEGVHLPKFKPEVPEEFRPLIPRPSPRRPELTDSER